MCLFLPALLFRNNLSFSTVSLNTIAGNCLFSLPLCGPDPSLRLALHWQVCSQFEVRFCCAMLCKVKAQAGGATVFIHAPLL